MKKRLETFKQLAELHRETFDAQKLVRENPLHISNANKKLVFEIASPPEATHSGSICVSRWKALEMPSKLFADDEGNKRTTHAYREDIFRYELSSLEQDVSWWVNFADHYLFGAYGGPLLAQDEMQVVEHPALASLREELVTRLNSNTAGGGAPFCTEKRKPTPILVRGVERRIELNTMPSSSSPGGLYGNNFARALPQDLRKAIRVLKRPTLSNIICMVAIPGGYGEYTREQIDFTFITAYTSFMAARVDSWESLGRPENFCTIVNTGKWGTGAFGGNPVLMALLQIMAADASGIEKLVYYTVGPIGNKEYLEAFAIYNEKILPVASSKSLSDLLQIVTEMNFQWGEGNGT